MMTPRECFHAAMNHGQPDRLLLDMGKHIGSIHRRAYAKLREHLGDDSMVNENLILDRMAQTVVPDESLLQRFDIDFRWVVPNWVQITERKDVPGYIDMWGVPYKATEDWDHCVVDGAPMRQATIETLDDYQWPDPNDPKQFEGLRERAKHLYENTDYVVGADAIKAGVLMNSLQMRGYDQFFMDLAIDVPFAEALMDRILHTLKEMWSRYMDAVGDYVQIAYVTDDLGSQSSLLISPRMFRTTAEATHEGTTRPHQELCRRRTHVPYRRRCPAARRRLPRDECRYPESRADIGQRTCRHVRSQGVIR